MNLEVSVLVVGYKNRRHLEACLGGAERSLEGISSEILFIDCSNDGSEQFVRSRFKRVRVVPHQGNLGFARGNNLLAELAHGRLILLLNPDTVPISDELARLVRFAQTHPDAAAWGGRCVNREGRPDPGSHHPMLTPLGVLLVACGLGKLRRGALRIDASAPQAVQVISGAFMLVRADVWRTIGGFDTRFFMYTEEVDLCYRIALLGVRLLADPTIVLIHDAGSGDPYSPERRIMLLKGNATFMRKHHGPAMATCACLAMMLNETRRMLGGSLGFLQIHGKSRRRIFARSLGALQHSYQWWPGWRGCGKSLLPTASQARQQQS